MEKIIVCRADVAEERIQPLLEKGWTVKFCRTERLTGTSNFMGKFVFILEKSGEYRLTE